MCKMIWMAVLGMLLFAATSYGALTHQYSFTTDASDSVGTANGSLIGGATVSGGVLNLDGIDDAVQFAQHIVPTSGSYTVALFARQAAPQTGSYIELISQGSSGAGYYIGHNNSNPAVIRAGDAWSNTGVLFPTDGATHHYALVVDSVGNSSTLYLDGVFAASTGLAIATTSSGDDTRLGSQFGGFGEFFHGTLDDVRVYDNALSASEVAAILAPPAAVPEPATAGLLIGVGVGAGIPCRRRIVARALRFCRSR